MKKFLSVIMAAVLAFALCACGKTTSDPAIGSHNFRSVDLGMTMEEVRNAESDVKPEFDFVVDASVESFANESQKTKDMIEMLKKQDYSGALIYNLTVNSVQCDVTYMFNNDGNLSDIVAEAKGKDAYTSLKEYFSNRYGTPTVDKENKTFWQTDDYVASVTMDGNSVTLGVFAM